MGLANVQFRPYQDRAGLSFSLGVGDVHLVSQWPEVEGYTPPFRYREHFTTSVQRDPLFATRLRENGHHQKQGEELGGHYSILGFVHTFDQLLPPAKYFKEHPEWYSDANSAGLLLAHEDGCAGAGGVGG